MIGSTEVQCLRTVVDHKYWRLWHLRFGHLNFRSLNQLIIKDMVNGIPSLVIPYKLCEGFLVGSSPESPLFRLCQLDPPAYYKQYIEMNVSHLRIIPLVETDILSHMLMSIV